MLGRRQPMQQCADIRKIVGLAHEHRRRREAPAGLQGAPHRTHVALIVELLVGGVGRARAGQGLGQGEGAGDLLVDVAAELPMQMICILLGVPEAERHWLFEAIEPQFDFGGSRKASIGQLTAEEAGSRMYTYGQELIAAKRAAPRSRKPLSS